MASTQTKQARYEAKRRQAGDTRLNCWMTPEAMQRLERLCERYTLSKSDVIAASLWNMEARK